MMAANNVYRKYSGEPQTILRLHQAELEVRELTTSVNWTEDQSLVSSLNDVNNDLCKFVYKLFNKRVYWFNKKMIENYSDQPIIIYGGGIRLPILNRGSLRSTSLTKLFCSSSIITFAPEIMLLS